MSTPVIPKHTPNFLELTSESDHAQLSHPVPSSTSQSGASSAVILDQQRLPEAHSLVQAFFTSFGLAAPAPGADPSVFDLLFKFMQELKKSMNEMKLNNNTRLAESAVSAYDATIKGAKDVLAHAKTAMMYSIAAGAVSIAGSATTVGLMTRSGVKARNEPAAREKALAEGTDRKPKHIDTHADSQKYGAMQAGVGGMSGIFTTASKMQEAEGGFDQKQAEAITAFIQTLMEFMRGFDKTIESLWNNLSQIHSATVSAEKSFKYKG